MRPSEPPEGKHVVLFIGACGLCITAFCVWRWQTQRSRHENLLNVLAQIDEAHAQDPTKDPTTGEPQELVYAKNMTKWLYRLVPNPSPALQVACRAQHLERWLYPRDAYPKTKEGYHKWRTAAKVAHSKRAAELLQANGLGDLASRVEYIIMKKGIGIDDEAQAMEDAACLVFLEMEASKFVAQEEDKGVDFMVNIFQKTWGKMSENGHALALKLDLPPNVATVVAKALGSS